MKKLLSILLLLTATIAQAQNARDILDKTAEAIRKKGATTVQFNATASVGTSDENAMGGTMYLDGKKYRLESDGLTIWYDGETQWSHLHGSDEVNISNPTEAEMQSVNPYAFLNVYKKGYRLSMRKSKLRGFDTYEVQLKAQGKKQVAELIYIDVKQSDFTPLCVRVRQDGRWSRIAITSLKGGQNFSPGHFSFNRTEHPELEIIDLR